MMWYNYGKNRDRWSQNSQRYGAPSSQKEFPTRSILLKFSRLDVSEQIAQMKANLKDGGTVDAIDAAKFWTRRALNLPFPYKPKRIDHFLRKESSKLARFCEEMNVLQ